MGRGGGRPEEEAPPGPGWPGKIRAQAGGEGRQPPAEHLLEEGGTPLSGAFPLLAAAGEETGRAHPSNFPVQEKQGSS